MISSVCNEYMKKKFAFYNSFLKIGSDLLIDKMFSFTCFAGSCSKRLVIFAEKYPRSSLLRNLQYLELHFL